MFPNTIEELIEVSADPRFEVRISGVRSGSDVGPTLWVELSLATFLLGPPRRDAGTCTLRFSQVEPATIPGGQAILRNFTEASVARRWQYTFSAGQLNCDLIAGVRAVLSP
jgi:hypothetical protein